MMVHVVYRVPGMTGQVEHASPPYEAGAELDHHRADICSFAGVEFVRLEPAWRWTPEED